LSFENEDQYVYHAVASVIYAFSPRLVSCDHT